MVLCRSRRTSPPACEGAAQRYLGKLRGPRAPFRGLRCSFPGHPRPSSLAIILKNQQHTASQTEMRAPTVLVVTTSGSLSWVLYGVMGAPPLKAAVAGDLKAAVAGDRLLL